MSMFGIINSSACHSSCLYGRWLVADESCCCCCTHPQLLLIDGLLDYVRRKNASYKHSMLAIIFDSSSYIRARGCCHHHSTIHHHHLFLLLLVCHKNKYPHKSTQMQTTYVMIKPDGVQRGLIAPILDRFLQKGYTLRGLKFLNVSKELAEQHYSDLSSKPFFPSLIEYITSGPVVAIALEGEDVVKGARSIIGATNPKAADPGSIRGTYCIAVGTFVLYSIVFCLFFFYVLVFVHSHISNIV